MDNTFIGMCNGEGTSAHNRSIMHVLIAGCKNEIKLGQHIAGANEHTARVWVSALNALGMNSTRLGEVSGLMSSIL